MLDLNHLGVNISMVTVFNASIDLLGQLPINPDRPQLRVITEHN